jgi:hypothetical protein
MGSPTLQTTLALLLSVRRLSTFQRVWLCEHTCPVGSKSLTHGPDADAMVPHAFTMRRLSAPAGSSQRLRLSCRHTYRVCWEARGCETATRKGARWACRCGWVADG